MTSIGDKPFGRFSFNPISIKWSFLAVLAEQLTLNQRARGSTPVQPTIFSNHLRRSRQDPARGKNCFRPVSGSWAGLLSLLILMYPNTVFCFMSLFKTALRLMRSHLEPLGGGSVMQSLGVIAELSINRLLTTQSGHRGDVSL